GKSGWVPEAYLERHGDTGILRCDYDAIELTIHVAEILTFHKAESGFFWVTDQAGRQGWVPASHVEAHEIIEE
ncbi:MAG: SH3 domain-containing protein, partial [Anaerolineales bacterium]|nr:SH3 domain-containing protein [Anaerolineales bacterium]